MLYSTIQIKQFLNTICTLRFFASICFLYLGLATIALSEADSIKEINGTERNRDTVTDNGLESQERLLGEGPFITTWKTDNVGITTATQIEIPTAVAFGLVYNYSVYWEDVNNAAINGTASAITGNHIIDFPVAGTYRVEISGDFPQIYFVNGGDKSKILTVEQWGDIAWAALNNAFYGCNNLMINATDAPDLSRVSTMRSMFRATNINEPIGHWDLSNVTDIGYLFRDASQFNQDISNWNVSNVTVMNHMFMGATNFNQPIGNWDVSQVTKMNSMFYGAFKFNQDIGAWNVERVTEMQFMFQDASTFNQDISNWNVSSVIQMGNMFRFAAHFNQPIGNWDISQVISLSGMFRDAIDFDQDLSQWDLSNVTNIDYLFYGASSFDQNISNWNVSNIERMSYMLKYSGVSPYNYDALLQGWLENGVKNNISNFQVDGLNYCQGEAARSVLMLTHGWNITGDIKDCSQTITFTISSPKVYDDADFQLNGEVSSGAVITYTSSDPSVATISGDTLIIKGVGATTITASQSGSEFYSAATPVSRELLVNKAEQTITFDALSPKTVGDAAFDLSATASSGLPVTYTSSDETIVTVTGSTVNLVGVGEVTITASQDGNENYNAAPSVEQILEVNNKDQTITFNALSAKTILDPAFDLTATASSGLDLTYTSSDETVASVSGSTVTIVGLGTATITASQAGNDEYAPAAEVIQNLVVNKAPQIISLEPIADKESNAPDFDVLVSASSGLDVNISINGPATILGKTISLNGTAGTVTLTAVQSGNETYLAAEPVEVSFNVIAVTGIAELEKEGIKIYPNPTSDYLNIEVNKSKELTISLLSADGALVSVFKSNSQRLDLTSLGTGVYILKLVSSDSTLYYKILKR